MENAMEVTELSKSYGTKKVLDGLTFSVKKGTVFGLLGANGAGKTTAIEGILGTRTLDGGTVKISGCDPKKDRKKLFQKIGVQFQEGDYQQDIKAGELYEEISCLYRERACGRELFERFGIGGKENLPVKMLSGGERQRLFLVLALAGKPEVVFLDELTTGLDLAARREVWQVLKELKGQGLTVLLTSHFMDEVEALCDQICILDRGKAASTGTVEEAKEQTGSATLEEAVLKIARLKTLDTSENRQED